VDVGAAREAQSSVALDERASIVSVAAVTPTLAGLLHLTLDDGVVISDRMWQTSFGGREDVRGSPLRIDGADTRVAGAAPEWLEGLYFGRTVDIWMPLRETSLPPDDRRSRTYWMFGRLHPGVSIQRVRAMANATQRDGDEIVVLPYTGMMPDTTDGM